ncbi:hypothetical protein Nepgr_006690 [Nepenthes gracilis]|uniref:Uncharacterized protein n=1 Tax=Nepenthes gracilis TaxID=150966 RepID=A0AAD3S5X5_NEPGR|nr:hypothetical protein Nepgr_006690 [Nepenthes gracilis]
MSELVAVLEWHSAGVALANISLWEMLSCFLRLTKCSNAKPVVFAGAEVKVTSFAPGDTSTSGKGFEQSSLGVAEAEFVPTDVFAFVAQLVCIMKLSFFSQLSCGPSCLAELLGLSSFKRSQLSVVLGCADAAGNSAGVGARLCSSWLMLGLLSLLQMVWDSYWDAGSSAVNLWMSGDIVSAIKVAIAADATCWSTAVTVDGG